MIRPIGTVMCSTVILTLILLFVTLLEERDAYTAVPLTAVGGSVNGQRFLRERIQPARMLQQQTKIENRAQSLLYAELEGSSDNSPKKKRRRKQSAVIPETSSSQTMAKSLTDEQLNDVNDNNDVEIQTQSVSKDIDLVMMNEVAMYEFNQKIDAPIPSLLPNILDDTKNNPFETQQSLSSSSSSTVSGAIPLPDIKEARKRKQMEEEMARLQQEQEVQKVKIKRTDKEAFRRLLEQQPFADADESYFEEEQYGAVSALLGERAKPFLSIPLGPLQVGHFIGSLVFVLMAYIEYPGFPLTNLPTPLRECFQGGLGSVYAINSILAIIVAVKVAPDRGQPLALWMMKTFTVGGIAFDQLMQLPTLVEIEKAKAVKGSRAMKKKPSTR